MATAADFVKDLRAANDQVHRAALSRRCVAVVAAPTAASPSSPEKRRLQVSEPVALLHQVVRAWRTCAFQHHLSATL